MFRRELCKISVHFSRLRSSRAWWQVTWNITIRYWWRHVNFKSIQNSCKTWTVLTSVLSDWRAAATCGELSVPSKRASADGEPRPVDSLRTPVTNHMMDGNTVNAPFGEQSAGSRDSARTVAAIRCAWKWVNQTMVKTSIQIWKSIPVHCIISKETENVFFRTCCSFGPNFPTSLLCPRPVLDFALMAATELKFVARGDKSG